MVRTNTQPPGCRTIRELIATTAFSGTDPAWESGLLLDCLNRELALGWRESDRWRYRQAVRKHAAVDATVITVNAAWQKPADRAQ